MKILKYLVVTVLVFMVTFTSSANAAFGDTEFASGDYSGEITPALKNLVVGVNNFITDFQQKTTDISEKLFLYLSIIAISFTGIKLAMSSGGSLSEPMSALIKTIFLIGFTTWLLNDGYNLMVVAGIDGLCSKLAELALPGTGTKFEDGFINFSTAQFSILGDILKAYTEQGWWETFNNFGSMLIFTVLLMALFIIFSLLALIAFMSVIVTVGIALAVGPIFIPFLVLEKTSFLFDGWVRFMIAASFTKVIIAIIVSIGLYSFKAIGTGQGGIMGMMIVTTALGGMLAFMLLRAPEIAQSIMSGSAVSFAKFGAKTMGSGMKGIAKLIK